MASSRNILITGLDVKSRIQIKTLKSKHGFELRPRCVSQMREIQRDISQDYRKIMSPPLTTLGTSNRMILGRNKRSCTPYIVPMMANSNSLSKLTDEQNKIIKEKINEYEKAKNKQ